MIYLIFSQAGFEDAKQSVFENNATLWVNNDSLTDTQLAGLLAAGIVVNTFKKPVDPTNEKQIIAAIESIETESPDTELFVEYL
jgi:hypothetical protein